MSVAQSASDVRPSPWLPHALLRCLGPLTTGRKVEIWGADPGKCLPGLAGAASLRKAVASGKGSQPADVLICLDPYEVERFLALPVTRMRLAAGKFVVAWSVTAQPLAAPAALHHAHYLHGTLGGELLAEAAFTRSRVMALHGLSVGEASSHHLLIWSEQDIPPIVPGFYRAEFDPAAPVDVTLPEPFPPAASAPRRSALADRLLCVEDRTMALRSQNRQLSEQLATHGGSGNRQFFDFPRVKHGWLLAERPDAEPAEMGLYDHRPNDAVILEAQRGVRFMGEYGLLGEQPDFSGAVEALNTVQRDAEGLDPAPLVSVIVPVYGQLAYTLNTLHSLLLHRSRHGFEIIVVDDASPDPATREFLPQLGGIVYHRLRENGGFINCCNAGGRLARGQFVILLNSDVRVVEHWLDEIIDSFALFPRAGLVGSKMLYPDGVLQEAGGIIWRDGSPWNYGREDDPNRPQYCYARQVDYISGCSIALRTALWTELQGFDPHYKPAYAEDADLCQRVIAAGLEVWFQPTSRVVHYEGKTSGTSTSGGVKSYQIVNIKKLFLRWRSRFETYRRCGDAPFLERERSVRKRILFLDAVTPTPNQDAGSLQTVLGLRCANASGYKVHFAAEDNWLYVPGYTDAMQREGIECGYAPYDVGLENYLRMYGWMFDAILVYRVGVMHKSLPLIKQYAPNAVILFHLADLHYLRQARQAQLDGSEPAAMEAVERTKARELDAIRQSHCTITHSTVEAEIIDAEVPGAPVVMWPLMIEGVGTAVPFEARRDICFLGGFRHPPNADAMLYFTETVFPLILTRHPEMRLIIAGSNPTPAVLALASEQVVVTGLVDDLADVFDAVRVFVCPLRVGAGAKGKVMSALSYGLPIVSTAIGVEGAGLVDGEHVLVADEAADMAAAVTRLYDDPVLWQAMSAAGVALVREHFSLGMGAQKLEEAIDKAFHHRSGLTGA